NVRELENILEHALIICREAMILPDHLPGYVMQDQPFCAATDPAANPAGSNNQERRRILAALEKSGGHRGNAARELNMERTTLWRKMKKLNIGDQ
ncbi:MAG: Fis family transcriptional regulator, partial [Desulfosarcina sp.]|nr:Fis family transcriptional regulator [Desulfosarcina sp.]